MDKYKKTAIWDKVSFGQYLKINKIYYFVVQSFYFYHINNTNFFLCLFVIHNLPTLSCIIYILCLVNFIIILILIYNSVVDWEWRMRKAKLLYYMYSYNFAGPHTPKIKIQSCHHCFWIYIIIILCCWE